MTADLSLAEFPDRKFQGKVVRTADDINLTTRTLLIEIDVDNPTGTLLTGSYAEVHLAIPTRASTFLIPVNTLLFRTEGLRLGVVKDGKVVLTSVTPGHDFGNEIEIVAGLKSDDQVIINPPDSILSGQEVQIVQATLPGDIQVKLPRKSNFQELLDNDRAAGDRSLPVDWMRGRPEVPPADDPGSSCLQRNRRLEARPA